MNPLPSRSSKALSGVLSHDTSGIRFVTAMGAALVGVGYLTGFDTEGYPLMHVLFPLWLWGLEFLLVGLLGMWGAMDRLDRRIRLALHASGVWVWSFLAFAALHQPPTPAVEILLALPVVIEAWSFVQVMGNKKRRQGDAT